MTPTPPAPRRLPSPPSNQQSSTVVTFDPVVDSVYGHRSILYGAGGIGKSTLACRAPGPVAFFDADESLSKLKPQLIKQGIPVPVHVKVSNWAELRSKTQASGWDKIKTIVYDTWAPIETWLVGHTLKTVRKDGGSPATSVEDYGYGKGYRHVFDQFLPFLGDLDRHIRAGRNVIIVCHDDANKVPNPGGQDFLRWEPKMQHTPSASVRYRMKEWSDHTLFLSFDIAVVTATGDSLAKKAGRAKGSGTRSLYTSEQPHFMAKSRTTDTTFDVTPETEIWPEIFI